MNLRAILLLVLGLAQMSFDVLGLAAAKGVAAATGASPAPKVFSAVRGFETYSTRFHLEWRDHAGGEQSVAIDPELYARIRGPYNRRNVYGAALAYGPVLAVDPETAPMLGAVLRHALCGEAPLLREIGIDPAEIAGDLRLRLEPLPGTDLGGLPRTLAADCESRS